MSRLYNDYGSLARDIGEGNLNSVNFPEFHGEEREKDGDAAKEPGAGLAAQKAQVLEIAVHEREAAAVALAKLLKALEGRRGEDGRRIARVMRLFIGVSELYADIYVARDLSNQVKGSS